MTVPTVITNEDTCFGNYLPWAADQFVAHHREKSGGKNPTVGQITAHLEERLKELTGEHGSPCFGVISVPQVLKLVASIAARKPSGKSAASGSIASGSSGKPVSMTHAELKELIKNAPGEIVEGLIPEKTVNILIGDSGLGKSPLVVLLLLCVAAGIPFLGLQVRAGVVIYVDYENGQKALDNVLDTLCKFLGLQKVPDNFRVLQQPTTAEVEAEIKRLHPILVVIDALRGYDPEAEENNTKAGKRLKHMQRFAEQNKTAFLIVHHTRKPSQQNPPDPLIDSDVMPWLLQASGAKALINQTFVRVGIDKYEVGSSELVIKGHYKLSGPFGPWQLGRIYDENGEPVGYYRLSGLDLLPPDQRTVLSKLRDEFTFGDVEGVSGRNPKAVAQWLKQWVAAGVIEKHGKARSKQVRYVKIVMPGPRM